MMCKMCFIIERVRWLRYMRAGAAGVWVGRLVTLGDTMGAHHAVNTNFLLQAAVGLHDVSDIPMKFLLKTHLQSRPAAAFIHKILSRDCISVRKN